MRMRRSVVAMVAAVMVGLPSHGLLGAPAALADAGGSMTWGPCDRGALSQNGFECARLVVPVDAADAEAGTFSLAVARHRSTGTGEQRIGSLFFNPGGPGGAGLDSAGPVWGLLPDSVKARFDLVTWDPRGIGATTPALRDCRAVLPVRPWTGPVSWNNVARRFHTAMATANRACYDANRSFISHMGTLDAVADLDRLRVAVGDQRLTYWGMSYGTRIGYVYALLHPDRVRALLLDGPIDPASTAQSLTEGAAGPDQAYGVFAELFPSADTQFRASLARLDRATLALPGGTRFTRWQLLDTVMATLHLELGFAETAKFVGLVHTAIFGTPTQATAARARLAHATLPGADGAGGAFSVVNCTDYPQRPGLTEVQALVRQVLRVAPWFGGTMGTGFADECAGLPLTPAPVPVITGTGPDVPALVTGATRDASTVSTWLPRMSRALPASRTITYAGAQHVVYRIAGSACVDTPVTRYLLTTRLPIADIGCPNVASAARQ